MSTAFYASNKNIPKDMLLGNIIFYSIGDMEIEKDVLVDTFKAVGLSESYIRDISPSDAYRRATSAYKKKAYMIAGKPTKIEVDEIADPTDEKIIRIIGKKKLDPTSTLDSQVSYDAMASISFDKRTGKVDYELNPFGDSAELHDFEVICEDAIKRYNRHMQYHNRDTIKNIFTRILNNCFPVSVTESGLCKFIPITKEDTLYSMKEALKMLSGHVTQGVNSMEILPLIDTADQRNLINEHFDKEMTDELVAFLTEINDVVNQKTIPVRTANAYVRRYDDLLAKTNEYSSLLDNGMKALQDQLGKVLQLIDDNKQ